MTENSVLQYRHIKFHSHQQWIRIIYSFTSSPMAGVLSVSKFLAFNKYVMITHCFICNPPVTYVEHVFKFLIFHLSYFGDFSVHIFCPFLFGVSVILLLCFKSSVVVLGISHLSDKCFTKDFLLVCDLPFHSLNTFSRTGVFHFNEVKLSFFSLLGIFVCVSYWKIYYQTQGHL